MLPFEFILMMELWAIVCLEGNPSQFDACLHNLQESWNLQVKLLVHVERRAGRIIFLISIINIM